MQNTSFEGSYQTKISTRKILKDTLGPVEFKRTLEWIGAVNEQTLSRVIGEIKHLLLEDSHSRIYLAVNSHGGPTGIGMTFFDLIQKIYRPNLQTIGTGDVDSSGIIIFLTGTERLLMNNTTLLFHMAGRYFDNARRVTTADMRAMLKEDTLKDHQYASVVAHQSGGKLTQLQVLEMMRANTVLDPEEAVELGIAHGII